MAISAACLLASSADPRAALTALLSSWSPQGHRSGIRRVKVGESPWHVQHSVITTETKHRIHVSTS